jgi:hypothetical protein
MRSISFALLTIVIVLFTTPLSAEPDALQKPIRIVPDAERREPITYEIRELATHDFTNIQLNAVSGNISFTVGDVEYVYYPRTKEHSTPAADTVACIAVLGELRKTDGIKVRVAVRESDLPADRKRINLTELIIPIAPLK